MNYSIQITTSDGVAHHHVLSLPQTTVGTDAAATICLAGEPGIVAQHLLLAPREADCWVSTTPGAPLWDSRGQAVEGAYVPWGSRLTIGRCAFELLSAPAPKAKNLPIARNQVRSSPDTGGESVKPPGSPIHPGILMILIVTLGFGAMRFLPRSGSATHAELARAPALFDANVLGCTSANPAHRAELLEDEAHAKSERSVFDLQDGVAAVHLYAEAASCYRDSGKMTTSEEIASLGTSLRSSIEEEYELLRLRLSRNLAENNREGALTQVRRLSELLRHKANGPYALTLRRLSARLTQEVSIL